MNSFLFSESQFCFAKRAILICSVFILRLVIHKPGTKQPFANRAFVKSFAISAVIRTKFRFWFYDYSGHFSLLHAKKSYSLGSALFAHSTHFTIFSRTSQALQPVFPGQSFSAALLITPFVRMCGQRIEMDNGLSFMILNPLPIE